MEKARVLELFSGIGGMHFSLNESKVPSEVILAIDINDIANKVYHHNFPDHKVISKNIKGLTPAFINKLQVNTILMSPPCQPFTRNGKFLDIEDARTDPFNLICELIPDLTTIEFILMENVMGFEKSIAREMYLKVLENNGYYYQEFIISPTELGVPNTRHRYYCLARKFKEFKFKSKEILRQLPDHTPQEVDPIKTFLESDGPEKLTEYLLPAKILSSRYKVFAISTPDSMNSMCFTKAYTHYLEGTGSIFTSIDENEVEKVFDLLLNRGVESKPGNKKLKSDLELEETSEDPLKLLKPLKLRYFTPKEVSRLMKFPESFSFPEGVTRKQKYRLLGNSINVAVVSELIKLLFS
uniref:tRNA (cytosine(38)-C(5))-methyltransferase n=1 Tax=Culicoides sonorensis TaxID=179676 RepID=A0A336LUK9_CULSO